MGQGVTYDSWDDHPLVPMPKAHPCRRKSIQLQAEKSFVENVHMLVTEGKETGETCLSANTLRRTVVWAGLAGSRMAINHIFWHS